MKNKILILSTNQVHDYVKKTSKGLSVEQFSLSDFPAHLWSDYKELYVIIIVDGISFRELKNRWSEKKGLELVVYPIGEFANYIIDLYQQRKIK